MTSEDKPVPEQRVDQTLKLDDAEIEELDGQDTLGQRNPPDAPGGDAETSGGESAGSRATTADYELPKTLRRHAPASASSPYKLARPRGHVPEPERLQPLAAGTPEQPQPIPPRKDAAQSPWMRAHPISGPDSVTRVASPYALRAEPETTRTTRPASERPSAPERPPAQRPSAPGRTRQLELLHFTVKDVRRMRRDPLLRRVLDDLEDEPVDAALDALADYAEIEEQREVFHLLTHAQPVQPVDLAHIFEDSHRADGKVVPPLCVVECEIQLAFASRERLAALAAAAHAFVPLESDDALEVVLGAVDHYLAHATLDVPAVVDSLTGQLLGALDATRRRAERGDFVQQAEQALIMQRHYQRSGVFGGPHLCATLRRRGLTSGVPGYIPEAAASHLPLQPSFDARLVVELRPRIDPRADAPLAVRVLALARVLDDHD